MIADIDILRKRPEFANLLEAVGERFESFEADYNDVASALGGLEKEVKPDQFVQVLGALSKQVSSENLISKNVRRELQMLWRNTSDWSEAKKYGLTKLSGATHSRAKIFFDRLAALGIFIVPVGELEGWWREGPPDKSDWAIAAIKKIEEDPGPFEAAIRFITRVCSHFGRTYTATGP